MISKVHPFSALMISALFFLSLLGLPEKSTADLYVYVDAQGAVHVTHEPLNGKRRRLISTYKSRPMPREDLSGNAETFSREIAISAAKYGVEEELIRAVIKAESSFDPYAVSIAGALGLMQLMPETAKRFGVEDSFDPVQNIDGGVHYLMKLNKMFEDPKLAIAAYHAGENRVAAYGDIPPIPATLKYVDRVLRYYGQYKKIAKRKNKIYKVVLPDGKVLYTTSKDREILFKVE